MESIIPLHREYWLKPQDYLYRFYNASEIYRGQTGVSTGGVSTLADGAAAQNFKAIDVLGMQMN